MSSRILSSISVSTALFLSTTPFKNGLYAAVSGSRMATSYKNPPTLTDDKAHQTWKNEVRMCATVTELAKSKMGVAVALSLSGKARDAAVDIDVTVLNAHDGLDRLLLELDRLFEKEKVDLQYLAYSKFENCKRNDGASIDDFIVEFEQLYNRAKKQAMELPDAVLAYKLSDNANLFLTDKQLALSACSELKFSSVKTALHRIFSQTKAEPPSDILFTQSSMRPGFHGQTKTYAQRGKFRVRGGSNGQQTNAIRNGEITKCNICESIYHYARDCQHKENQAFIVEGNSENVEEIAIIDSDDYITFVAEANFAAILDTACSKTMRKS